MKNVYRIFWIIVAMTSVIAVSAQSIDDSNTSSLIFNSGIGIPLGDMRSGDVVDIFIDRDFQNGYGLSRIGFNFGIEYTLRKSELPIDVTGSIQAYSFSNSETFTIQNFDTRSESTLKLTGRIYSFIAGIRLPVSLTPTSRFYFGAEPALNLITGKSYRNNSSQSKVKTSPRLGLNLRIGSEFLLSSKYFLDVSLKYQLANLIGKSYDIESSNGSGLYLNDGKNPDNPNDSDRNIHFFSFHLGAGFYFH